MAPEPRGVSQEELTEEPAAPAKGNSTAGRRRRGRPSSAAARQVYGALVTAAEQCLEHKHYSEITVREIAAEAQVNPAMVNYYFDGKEGLFIALVEFLFSDWSKRLRQIETPSRHSPTKRFVEAVHACFYKHRTVLWLIDHELRQKESAIAEVFKGKLASQTTAAIRRFIKAMGEQGHYRTDGDLHFLAYAVSSLSLSPIGLGPRLERSYGIGMDELGSESWLAHLEQSLDRLLRPA